MAGEQSYKGKLAVITGGASGLGLTLAHRLVALGAKPLLVDIAQSETPFPLELADITDAGALATAITRLKDTHGPIDLVIANAGIDLTGEAHDFGAGEWRKIVETNLIGATNLISATYPDMVARKEGQLILVSSGAGLIGFPLGAPYTASKAGLIGLGKALRAEAAQYGVRVSVACPPILDTPLLQNGKAKSGINRPAFIASLQKTPMSAEDAAHRILKAAAKDKSLVIFPASLRLGHVLATLCPPLGAMIHKGILGKFNRYGRK